MEIKIQGRNGILYPMLVIAAVAVVIFNVFGGALLAGLIPLAHPSGGGTGAVAANAASVPPVAGDSRISVSK